ncbi:MAG: hypothetical protein WKG07_24205 [Hymenobacter sp.]
MLSCRSFRWALGPLLWLGARTHVPAPARPGPPSRPALGPNCARPRSGAGCPMPLRKTVVAVYKFRDQTGQYKPRSQRGQLLDGRDAGGYYGAH